MKLILIRHGLTTALEENLCYGGGTDLHLSSLGREKLAAAVKAGLYPDFTGYRIITSGMVRCEETLEIIVGKVPHEKIYDFHEMEMGIFEMRSYKELMEDPEYKNWINGDVFQTPCPGGESGKILIKRAGAALESVIRDGRDAALFIHGGVIFALMRCLLPGKAENVYEWQPKAGGGYIIELPTGYSLNDAGRWNIKYSRIEINL